MIRDITLDDKAEVLRLACMFFKERLEKENVYFSVQHAFAHFDIFIKTPGVLALCAEEEGRLVGMIAGVSSAIIFSKELAMQELVWYVEPRMRKCGLHLLREFERRAFEMGVTSVMMVSMAGDAAQDIYPKLGYKELHKTFIKGLK